MQNCLMMVALKEGKCSMGVYAGLDIGGTKLLVASADETGRILKRTRAETPPARDEGLRLINAMIDEAGEGRPLDGIGVAIGGPLDFAAGVVSPLHQPEWKNVPLREILHKRWQCPVSIDVDTNVAALGEYRAMGETAARFLYLTISTGMGGGFIVDGKVYRGSRGGHPEPAHISIHFRCSNPENISCECGAPDCLESLVSGNGIRRIYGRPAEELTEEQWDEVAYNLGQGLRNLSTLYCPDIISLGGGISTGRGERLLQPAVSIMKEHLRLVNPPQVRISRLGYDTALVGAISIAIHGV